jgi:hypothetical protein
MTDEEFNIWLTEYFFDRLENYASNLIRSVIERTHDRRHYSQHNSTVYNLSSRIVVCILDPIHIKDLKSGQIGLPTEILNQKIDIMFDEILELSDIEQSKFFIYSLNLRPPLIDVDTFEPFVSVMIRGFSITYKRINPYFPMPKKFKLPTA